MMWRESELGSCVDKGNAVFSQRAHVYNLQWPGHGPAMFVLDDAHVYRQKAS